MHWEACADHLIAGAAAHASPAGARVRFPGHSPADSTDELEGFARAFLLGALRLAGSQGDRPSGLAERYAQALDAGTRPGHPEAWPRIGHHDQVLVEATAVALGLHWSRPWLWNHLPDRTRAQLVAWLSGARGSWCADNNHVLFGATVQAFLASVGADHDSVAIDGALNRIDEWYAGDGWYSDGTGRRFDHYNGWTFHLYPFFIEQLLGGLPGGGAVGTNPSFEVYRTRLRTFLDDYQHLFDAAGNAVLQGRSLIYRWGMAAPFWMGELQGVSPLAPGRTRRLASGMLRGFVDAGELDDGVLGLGWKRPAPDLLQSYNAAGSPLWASKGFLGLLVSERHPAWVDVEEPMPVEQHDVLRPMGGPRWLAVGRRDDGIARLLNHGSDGHPQRPDPLYRRLAYSSATVAVSLDGLDDNTVTVGRRGSTARHRGLLAGAVHRESAVSRWRLDAQGRDVMVDLATVVVGAAEVRVARLRGVLDQTVRCTGWALSADAPLTTDSGPGWASATRPDGLVSGLAAITTADAAPAVATEAGFEVGVNAGFEVGVNAGFEVGVEAQPHSHALGEHVGLPWLEAEAGTEGAAHLAWLVHLGCDFDPTLAERVTVQWTPDGAVVTVEGRSHHCGWLSRDLWPADAGNQGIFRVGRQPLRE
ncbi:hypothetical protein BA895_11735 [Humibacillus sp. DSM 29435]|uniref:DUF2264 domain-containing protein n=1 Tax=Humibacillus sp. DSM 29435 TaxID=1869167 RepID=UPI000872195F|nr:DUF2264 domain-containing protein [Humibacillus sp. DSM 29435]OFE14272.1 hypothetical protein BA895_11735 [Humibacillus sp. DSM 29435]